MVLVSVQSVENNNGFQFSNDFAESLIIDPKSRISLININFTRNATLYTVDASNHEFLIRFGEYNNDYQSVRITHGNYLAVDLATEIQKQLNRHFFTMGYYFNFGFQPKDKTFFIHYTYTQNRVEMAEMTKWDAVVQPSGDGAAQIKYNSNTEEIEVTAALANGNCVYMTSQEAIETQIVPILKEGGSSITMMLRTNAASNTWPAAVPADSAPPTKGLVFGLTGSRRTVKYLTPKSIAEVTNMGWCSAGMGLVTTNLDGFTSFIRIIEEGHQIGVDIPHVIDDYTQYKIVLSQDGPDGVNGFPAYYFKRNGQINWTRVIPEAPPGGGSAVQVFSKEKWAERVLIAVVGTDNPVPEQATYPHFRDLMMAHANPNYIASDFAGTTGVGPVPATLTNTSTTGVVDYTFTNTDTTGVGTDLNALDVGYVSPLIEPNRQSRMTFRVPKSGTVAATGATGGRFQIAVLDETQRRKNFASDNAKILGTTDPASGPGATAIGGALIGDIAGTKHCSMLTFQIEGSKWFYRTTYNTFSETSNGAKGGFNEVTMARRSDITADIASADGKWTWGQNKNEVFYLTCHADFNKIELGVSPTGDGKLSDYIALKNFDICPADLSGVKQFTVQSVGDYIADGNNKFFRLSNVNNGCCIKGNIVNNSLEAVSIVTPGAGFNKDVTYNLTEIDKTAAGQPDLPDNTTTKAALTVTQLVDYNLNTDFSMKYSPTTSNNGYRYFVNVNNYVAENNAIENIGLYVEPEDDKLQANAYFFPNNKGTYPADSGFGAMMGFAKEEYRLSSDDTISDKTPTTGAGVLDENLIVNVNNLPIKTYIGKKMRKAAGINDDPVGNVQGLTKTIGKVPRYYEENGSSGEHLSGPFYYDYFPYSVPLHNAVELNINELDISINNQDGTLATDIAKTSLLLDITNVDNVGEGLHGGVTGNPIDAPRSFDMLNINNGQLQPEIKGGFAQGPDAGYTGPPLRPRPKFM